MSLINDALKRAQQNQPAPAPTTKIAPPLEPKVLPPLQPVEIPRNPARSRLIPAMLILLTVAAAVAAGWAATHRPAHAAAAPSPEPVKVETPAEKAAAPVAAPAAAPAVAAVLTPAVAPAASAAEPEPEAPINPPEMPKLQGICYVPGKPSAILDGRSVRAGDKILQYRVKEIGRFTVTLVDNAGKAFKLGMGN